MLDETHTARDAAVAVVDEPVEQVDDAGADGATVVPGPRRRRPSKWDRPRDPHDWRWVVGGVGRVLIATGILMFGFVAYQLWGTALQTAAAQSRLGDQFDDKFESMPTLPFPGDVTATTAGAPDGTDVDEPTVTLGDGLVPSGGTTVPGDPADTTETTVTPGAGPGAPDATAPGGGPAGPPASPAAPPSPIATPEPLEVVARLEIPSIGVDDYVIQGVTRAALKEGPGHFPETPLPGQLGNSAIAGHRTTYGAPFGDIDEIAVDDDIVVSVPGAGTYYYVTREIKIVAPEDYASVVPSADLTRATLTLVSCHPEYSTKQRFIVIAELDPSRSNIVTQPSDPAPPDVEGELPPEDVPATPAPTAPAETPAPVDPAPAASTPSAFRSGAGTKLIVTPTTDAAPSTTDAAATDSSETAPTTSVDAAAAAEAEETEEDGEDAFSAGWFDDDGAWPHLAGWGALLTLIALGSYWLSRRARRDWVGALVGIVPFLVTLYFFYENVNRLLPPAL
jgi:sortase A